MKPCIECGLAIHNSASVCVECGKAQESGNELRQTATENNDDESPVASNGLFLFITEVAARSAIVGMLPVCVLIAILYFLLPIKYAILLGISAGTAIGFVYSLIEMYFQNQTYRGPLG